MIQPRAFSALVAGLAFATLSPAATRYLIEDIGPVSSVTGMNNRGEVLARDPTFLPFLYHRGRVSFLPEPTNGTFFASALNDSGEVVGYFNPPGAYDYDLAIYRDGQWNIFDNVSGVDPVKVNDRGQIAGDAVSQYRTFIYSCGSLNIYSPENVVSATRGMNNRGDIVGVTDTSNSTRAGFVYRNGRFSTLSVPGAASSEADAINDQGDIAGMWQESTALDLTQIFTYRRGHFHNLGHVFGQSEEQDGVSDMNRFGVFVGTGRVSTIPNGGFSAYAYFPRKGFVELNTLIPPDTGWFLQFANAINDRGQIAGSGLLNGTSHGFILTPIHGHDEDEGNQSNTPEQ